MPFFPLHFFYLCSKFYFKFFTFKFSFFFWEVVIINILKVQKVLSKFQALCWKDTGYIAMTQYIKNGYTEMKKDRRAKGGNQA